MKMVYCVTENRGFFQKLYVYTKRIVVKQRVLQALHAAIVEIHAS